MSHNDSCCCMLGSFPLICLPVARQTTEHVRLSRDSSNQESLVKAPNSKQEQRGTSATLIYQYQTEIKSRFPVGFPVPPQQKYNLNFWPIDVFKQTFFTIEQLLWFCTPSVKISIHELNTILLMSFSSLVLRLACWYVALKASVIRREGRCSFSNSHPFKCLSFLWLKSTAQMISSSPTFIIFHIVPPIM